MKRLPSLPKHGHAPPNAKPGTPLMPAAWPARGPPSIVPPAHMHMRMPEPSRPMPPMLVASVRSLPYDQARLRIWSDRSRRMSGLPPKSPAATTTAFALIWWYAPSTSWKTAPVTASPSCTSTTPW